MEERSAPPAKMPSTACRGSRFQMNIVLGCGNIGVNLRKHVSKSSSDTAQKRPNANNYRKMSYGASQQMRVIPDSLAHELHYFKDAMVAKFNHAIPGASLRSLAALLGASW